MTFHATERETERVQKLRDDFRQFIPSRDSSRFVFIDESGSNCSMTPLYGRSEKGQRLHSDKPYHWGENITLLGALGDTGLRAMMTVDGGTTGEVFYAFIEQCLLPTLNPGDIVVLDNLSFYKVPGIRELIEGVGAMVYFLPPYSPDMNPIEKCWSKIKQLIRKLKPRSREALDNAVAWAMKQVSQDDVVSWYNCSGYTLDGRI